MALAQLMFLKARAKPLSPGFLNSTISKVCLRFRHGLVQNDCIRLIISVAAAKIDVFAKNGYNKCNKFRKIMKIIT